MGVRLGVGVRQRAVPTIRAPAVAAAFLRDRRAAGEGASSAAPPLGGGVLPWVWLGCAIVDATACWFAAGSSRPSVAAGLLHQPPIRQAGRWRQCPRWQRAPRPQSVADPPLAPRRQQGGTRCRERARVWTHQRQQSVPCARRPCASCRHSWPRSIHSTSNRSGIPIDQRTSVGFQKNEGWTLECAPVCRLI